MDEKETDRTMKGPKTPFSKRHAYTWQAHRKVTVFDARRHVPDYFCDESSNLPFAATPCGSR
jgi:hypothetical protein